MSQNLDKIVDIQNQTATGVAELLNRVESLEKKISNRSEFADPSLFSNVTKKYTPSVGRPQMAKSTPPSFSHLDSVNHDEGERFYDADTGGGDGNFQLVKARKKRLPATRKPNFIKGIKENDQVKGGFKYFDAFVYRVHSDTAEDDLKEFVERGGAKIIDFEKQ